MTLDELLAQNPAAKIEHEARIKAAGDAGEKSGREAVEKRVSGAVKYLGADSAYPESIKNLAVQTVKGESDMSALNAAVAGYDGALEAIKSAAAKNETAENGNAGNGQSDPAGLSTDGIIRTDADIAAARARMNGGK